MCCSISSSRDYWVLLNKKILLCSLSKWSRAIVGQVNIPGVKDVAMAKHLLRLLTPALKGHCSKTAIAGLQECMECMGGVGYLENDDMQFNIARLYRDANVLPIWEG